MKHEYKIELNKISGYTKRNDNQVLKILIYTMIGLTILIIPTVIKQSGMEGLIPLSISFIFTTSIIGLIYLNNKKLTKLSAENLKIIIDDLSITRIINLDNEPGMNFLHKYNYARAKIISDSFYSKISFSELKSIELKKGDLWIKSVKSNSFNGKNIIIVPRELKNFNNIKSILEEKVK